MKPALAFPLHYVSQPHARMFRRATNSGFKETAMTKYLMMLMLLLGGFAVTGCEADADIDDDGGKLEVDVDPQSFL